MRHFFQFGSEMGTSDGLLKPASLSSGAELNSVNPQLDSNPSRGRMDSPNLLTSSRSQLKALPKKCLSAQLVWVNRGKCGGILVAILKNEPTDLYTPDPLSNGSNYQSLTLGYPGMGLRSSFCMDTKMSSRTNSACTKSTVHRIFGN